MGVADGFDGSPCACFCTTACIFLEEVVGRVHLFPAVLLASGVCRFPVLFHLLFFSLSMYCAQCCRDCVLSSGTDNFQHPDTLEENPNFSTVY